MPVRVFYSTIADGSMRPDTGTSNEQAYQNRQNWLKKCGINIEDTSRISLSYEGDDYCRYHILKSSEKGLGMKDIGMSDADALITTDKNHAMFLTLADCVGTVLYDKANDVLMLTHLGRHSLEQKGFVKSFEFLKETYGTKAANVSVWLSPAANKNAYQIYSMDNMGLKEVLYEQLEEVGIRPESVIDNTGDTVTDPTLFSHTEFVAGRQEIDGRQAIVAINLDELGANDR